MTRPDAGRSKCMEWRGMQRSSSRREEAKIAQGETLGKRSPDRFPPHRGGVKPLHRIWIQRSSERVFDPPLWGGFCSLCLLPRAALRLPWAIFDGSLRERSDGPLMGWPTARAI